MTTSNTTRPGVIVFRISRYQSGQKGFYRVVARIPGFGPAYLVKPEGDCNFPNRSAAIKACKRRAITLGYVPEITVGSDAKQKATV